MSRIALRVVGPDPRVALRTEIPDAAAPLGLTESLEVGYRLSPRGRAVLRHIARSEA